MMLTDDWNELTPDQRLRGAPGRLAERAHRVRLA